LFKLRISLNTPHPKIKTGEVFDELKNKTRITEFLNVYLNNLKDITYEN